MIDVVIPLGSGSIWDNNELRYCLRSIEKCLLNYRKIYIIGECPDWVRNVIHIPATDNYTHERNIMEKIKIACAYPEISEDFLFMNDDQFFLDLHTTLSFPSYYSGTIRENILKRHREDEYKAAMRNTEMALNFYHHESKYYDVHYPIIYSKLDFPEIMDRYNWTLNDYVIKSLYCNTKGITGKPGLECKMKGTIAYYKLLEKVKPLKLFSIGDRSLSPYPGEEISSVKVLLSQLFKHKSKFEE